MNEGPNQDHKHESDNKLMKYSRIHNWKELSDHLGKDINSESTQNLRYTSSTGEEYIINTDKSFSKVIDLITKIKGKGSQKIFLEILDQEKQNVENIDLIQEDTNTEIENNEKEEILMKNENNCDFKPNVLKKKRKKCKKFDGFGKIDELLSGALINHGERIKKTIFNNKYKIKNQVVKKSSKIDDKEKVILSESNLADANWHSKDIDKFESLRELHLKFLKYDIKTFGEIPPNTDKHLKKYFTIERYHHKFFPPICGVNDLDLLNKWLTLAKHILKKFISEINSENNIIGYFVNYKDDCIRLRFCVYFRKNDTNKVVKKVNRNFYFYQEGINVKWSNNTGKKKMEGFLEFALKNLSLINGPIYLSDF